MGYTRGVGGVHEGCRGLYGYRACADRLLLFLKLYVLPVTSCSA